MICARIEDVKRLQKVFIKLYGMDQLIKDYNTSEESKRHYEEQVRKYRERQD